MYYRSCAGVRVTSLRQCRQVPLGPRNLRSGQETVHITRPGQRGRHLGHDVRVLTTVEQLPTAAAWIRRPPGDRRTWRSGAEKNGWVSAQVAESGGSENFQDEADEGSITRQENDQDLNDLLSELFVTYEHGPEFDNVKIVMPDREWGRLHGLHPAGPISLCVWQNNARARHMN